MKNKSSTVDYSTKNKTIEVFTSADSTLFRLSKTNSDLKFVEMKQPSESQVCVFVNPDKKFQTYLGIGGAITDASAEVFAKLSPENQTEFINAYYSKDKGIGYSLIRTNMSSCDFSSDMYDYITEGDKSLNSFNIEHDKKFKIPLIKKAMEAIGKNANLYISPWSPP
eukprot:gene2806-3987_t